MSKSVFYHFTSEKSLMISRIAGIKEGIIPLRLVPDPKNVKRNELKAMTRVVWLTKNSLFIGMDAPIGPPKSSMLPGRKAEYRLTIVLPPEYLSNVVAWPKFAMALKAGFNKRQSLDPAMEREINTDIVQPADWFIFGDFIPWAWVKSVDKNPSLPGEKVSIVSEPEKVAGAIMSFPKLDLPKKGAPSV